MQRVGPVVGGQLVFLAVERELALGDAVGDPAVVGAEIGMAAEVPFEIVESEDDVGDLAVPIGHVDLGDDGAVGDDFDGHFAVREHVLFDRSPVRGFAEVHLGHAP